MGRGVVLSSTLFLFYVYVCKINMETKVFHKLDMRGWERVTCDGLLIYFFSSN
jgi:hypothetical protein